MRLFKLRGYSRHLGGTVDQVNNHKKLGYYIIKTNFSLNTTLYNVNALPFLYAEKEFEASKGIIWLNLVTFSYIC